MKKFLIALFLSFGLSKIASIDKIWIHTKLGYYSNDKEVYDLLQALDLFYQKFSLYSLKAYDFIPSIKGMEASVLIMNFLITYTPIFFIIILIFSFIFKSKKPKPVVSDIPEKIRLYLDYMLEVELKDKIKREVQKELLRLQRNNSIKENKVA
jgi:hypothetical protein